MAERVTSTRARGSRCFRVSLRVLPVTATGTFLLFLGLCYDAYQEAIGRPGGPLQTISTYGVGPWDPSPEAPLRNLASVDCTRASASPKAQRHG